MSDFSTDVQASINAADAAQAAGNHSARAEHAANALKMLTDEYNAVHRPTPPTEPKTGVEAAARLAHLEAGKDQDFTRRWGAGDPAARREIETLIEKRASADPVEMAIAGVAPETGVDENMGAVASGPDLVAGAKHLRDLGFSDANVAEIYRGTLLTNDGKPLPAEEAAIRVARAEELLKEAGRNVEFRKGLLEGNQNCRDIWNRLCATVAIGKK